jgi:hypothetical protein
MDNEIKLRSQFDLEAGIDQAERVSDAEDSIKLNPSGRSCVPYLFAHKKVRPKIRTEKVMR